VCTLPLTALHFLPKPRSLDKTLCGGEQYRCDIVTKTDVSLIGVMDDSDAIADDCLIWQMPIAEVIEISSLRVVKNPLSRLFFFIQVNALEYE
jgi:hypothetical protein